MPRRSFHTGISLVFSLLHVVYAVDIRPLQWFPLFLRRSQRDRRAHNHPVLGGVVGRSYELDAAQRLLSRSRVLTSALILDGPAGIGKTTLYRTTSKIATESGFTVLASAGAASEVSLAWTALADLLTGLDGAVMSALAPLHRNVLQAVSAGHESLGGDERLLATAFLAALRQQTSQGPVLIAVDDAQWLDDASRLVLGFAIRRLDGPVAVLATYRTEEPSGQDRSWIRPSDPQALVRLAIRSMDTDGLREVIESRLGFTPPRSTMSRIHTLSGGNPFYALELARAVQGNPEYDMESLPPLLTEIVSDRVGNPDARTMEMIVMVSVAFEPTVELIAAAAGCSPADLVEALQPLESRGVLAFDGIRIRFTHPLIASGIISGADPALIRRAHRRLADVVNHPEPRARHLALSTPHGDPETLAALDVAAGNAAARGTYTTAADLIGLAIRRGGDTGIRRMRGAEFLFRAGALDEAESLIAPVIDDLPAGFMRTVGLMLIAGIQGYRDGVASAADVLQRAVQEAGEVLPLRCQALLFLSLAAGATGDLATCVEYSRRARADAEASGMPELRSQALALWVYVSANYGLGVDKTAMQEALAIGDIDTIEPVTLQPTAVYGVISAWTGQLDEARNAMTKVLRRCEERGLEIDTLWAAVQLTTIHVFMGRYAEAASTAREALARAEHIGGKIQMINGYTAVANAAAHQGHTEEATVAAELAIQLATGAGLFYLTRPPLMSLAFVQSSGGNYDIALQTLKPLLESFEPDHDTEIVAGAWLPDAVEALTATGRVEEAEPLVAALEINGVRHDRPWMLAVGARCRALILAAQGDLAAAAQSAERARTHHDRLPMPFELARTQLLLGQLQRRLRHARSARQNLDSAAAIFAAIGSTLWLERANRELDRLTKRSAFPGLTNSERRVAEYATAGLTNREIASAMFLSAKTVEMYLSSVYRKLGIRSRAQLADGLRRNDVEIALTE